MSLSVDGTLLGGHLCRGGLFGVCRSLALNHELGSKLSQLSFGVTEDFGDQKREWKEMNLSLSLVMNGRLLVSGHTHVVVLLSAVRKRYGIFGAKQLGRRNVSVPRTI